MLMVCFESDNMSRFSCVRVFLLFHDFGSDFLVLFFWFLVCVLSILEFRIYSPSVLFLVFLLGFALDLYLSDVVSDSFVFVSHPQQQFGSTHTCLCLIDPSCCRWCHRSLQYMNSVVRLSLCQVLVGFLSGWFGLLGFS